MTKATWRYIAVRFAQAIPLVFAVITMNFLIIKAVPGDPINVLVGDYPVPASYVDKLRRELRLDRPPYQQYIAYLSSFARADLGFSFLNRRPVAHLIVERLGPTLLLVGSAMVLAVVIGVPLGIAAARRPNSAVNFLSMSAALSGYSMPEFWLGAIALILLAVQWHVFPVQGMTSIRGQPHGLARVADVAWHLCLPMMVLSFKYMAIYARIARATMAQVLRCEFIVVARAKGLSERGVIWHHALRNALLPIVTVVGFNFGYVLSGSVFIETVFAWPGIGRLLYTSLVGRDYPVILGIFTVASVTVVVANLVTDLVYLALDPRISY